MRCFFLSPPTPLSISIFPLIYITCVTYIYKTHACVYRQTRDAIMPNKFLDGLYLYVYTWAALYAQLATGQWPAGNTMITASICSKWAEITQEQHNRTSRISLWPILISIVSSFNFLSIPLISRHAVHLVVQIHPFVLSPSACFFLFASSL